jgi:polyisoprenoid-binding protein YceI
MFRKAKHWTAALAAVVLSFGTAAFAQPRTFTFDAAQTQVAFKLDATLHTVHGSFQLKRGTITFGENGQASGELVVDATTGKSGNDSRDRHMHKDILESEKYPDIVFTPEHYTGTLNEQGKSHLVVEGQFSIHGASHPLTLAIDAIMSGGNATAATTFAIPYVKWGMKNPSTFILRVSDKAEITINAVARTAVHDDRLQTR